MINEITKLYVEPTSRCNLRCTMCFRKGWINEEESDLDSTLFYKLIESLPASVETVMFCGMGEPLMHQDIIQFVRAAARRVKNVELLTNATLLTPEMSGALIDAGLTMLWVSIDSLENQRYKEIRKDSILSSVLDNIRQFNEKRAYRNDVIERKWRRTALGLAFVAMKSNLNQINLLPTFAFEIGAVNVNISNVIPLDQSMLEDTLYAALLGKDLSPMNTDPYFIRVEVPIMDWTIAAGEVLNLLTAERSEIHIAGNPIRRQLYRCKFIEEGNVFVKQDGSISPCMPLLHSHRTFLYDMERTILHHSFGNITNQQLQEIWDSEEYRAFRNRVHHFDFPPCFRCGNCEHLEENLTDCFDNPAPVCGGCLWAEGLFSCP